MSGLFCILSSRPRNTHREILPIAHTDFGSLIPPGESIDGEAWQAQSMLFQLPIEVLIMVIEQISDTRALASFALVCRACNHFARWRRLQTVVLSKLFATEKANGLLKRLQREALAKTQTHPLAMDLARSRLKMPEVGTCVRQVVVRTDARSFALNMDEDLKDYEATMMYSEHLKTLAYVIKHALPNLRSIRFEDCAPIPRGMWHVVVQSPVRELDVFNSYIGNPMEPPLPPGLRTWPLISLTVGDIGTRGIGGNISSGRPLLRSVREDDAFISRLLELSAPTLKHLRLLCCSKSLAHIHDPFCLPSVAALSFPRLEELELNFACNNRETFHRLLKPSPVLRALSIAVLGQGPPTDQLWPDEPLDFPNLRYLAALSKESAYCQPNGTGIAFHFYAGCPISCVLPILRNPVNHGIQTLHLEQEISRSTIMQDTVLPLLSANFRNLTSLSLMILYTNMNHSILPIVGTLLTLRDLRIVSTAATVQQNYWSFSHREARQHLHDLRHLRRLAFGGDAYSVWASQPGDYYAILHLEREGAPPYDEREDDTPPPPGYDFIGPPLHLPEPPSHPESGSRFQVMTAQGSTSHVLQLPGAVPDAIRGMPMPGRMPDRMQDPAEALEYHRAPLWQREHESRMLRHARNWFVQFPKLQWIYCGKVLMAAPSSAGIAKAQARFPPQAPLHLNATPIASFQDRGWSHAHLTLNEIRGQRPRIVGPHYSTPSAPVFGAAVPGSVPPSGLGPGGKTVSPAAVLGYLDYAFGWERFVPRVLEEEFGVGVDYGRVLFGEE